MKLTGFDKLSKKLKQTGEAVGELDGDLGTLTFNPHDPASIEAAIVQMEQIIDQRLGAGPSNEIIDSIASGMKEQYREAIIERAAAARLAPKSEE